jgi:hypothetical protein
MMPEKPLQPANGDKESPRERGNSQYQHQTLTLNNTAGMVCMSIIAFVLLVALLRQQRRYHELAMKLALKY